MTAGDRCNVVMMAQQLNSGSRLSAQLNISLKEILERTHGVEPALYLDETPYFDEAGVQRIAEQRQEQPVQERG